MTKQEELANMAFEEGTRTAWRQIFAYALQQLGRDSSEWTEKHWLREREDVVASLRRVCAEWGDNDWQDDLNLADVIDKHLWRHLKDI